MCVCVVVGGRDCRGCLAGFGVRIKVCGLKVGIDICNKIDDFDFKRSQPFVKILFMAIG